MVSTANAANGCHIPKGSLSADVCYAQVGWSRNLDCFCSFWEWSRKLKSSLRTRVCDAEAFWSCFREDLSHSDGMFFRKSTSCRLPYGLLSSEARKVCEERVVDSEEMPYLCPCLFKTYIVWEFVESVLEPLEFIQWAGWGRSQSHLPAYQEPYRILNKNIVFVQNIFVKKTLNFHWNFLFLKLKSFWFSVKLSKFFSYKKLMFSTKITLPSKQLIGTGV